MRLRQIIAAAAIAGGLGLSAIGLGAAMAQADPPPPSCPGQLAFPDLPRDCNASSSRPGAPAPTPTIPPGQHNCLAHQHHACLG